MVSDFGMMLRGQRKYLEIKKTNPEMAKTLSLPPKNIFLEKLSSVPEGESVWPQTVLDIYNDPSN